MRRRQLEINLEAEKRIIELERSLILKEATEEGGIGREYDSRTGESSKNDNLNRKSEDIQKWIKEVKNSIDGITVLSFRSGEGADHKIDTGSGTGTNIDYEEEGFVEKKYIREDEKLSKFLARQSIIKQSFKLDNFGVKIYEEKMSEEEMRAVRIMEETSRRMENGTSLER
ncbi:hypothetical protein JTB14_020133 [Gonioctena quinquepunctata]|nr:hypothetical protein JTB14_020133 [Gonioctena quinquepunctata]